MSLGLIFLFAIGCLGIVGTLRIILIEQEFAQRFGGRLKIHPIRGWVLPDHFAPSDAAKAYLEEKKRNVATFNAVTVAAFLILFLTWVTAKSLSG